MDITDSWARSLRAANRSRQTIDSYLADVDHFSLFLAGHQLDRNETRHEVASALRIDHPIEDAKRGNIEEFLVWCRERGLADATVARRYRSLQQFYGWLDEEDEIDANPMRKMKPPKIVDQPPPIISPADMDALLAACRGELADGGQRRRNNNGTRLAEFETRRDTAIVTVLNTTGVRSAEVMGLNVDDINWNAETFRVTGKGGRIRSVALVPEALKAVDRYHRVRRRHPGHELAALWIGRKGPMTTSGLRQMLERRCADAGIEPINPHRFRHTFAHDAKVRGMTDENLMAVAGWQSPQMLARYGRAASEERAQTAHRQMFDADRHTKPGDSL